MVLIRRDASSVMAIVMSYQNSPHSGSVSRAWCAKSSVIRTHSCCCSCVCVAGSRNSAEGSSRSSPKELAHGTPHEWPRAKAQTKLSASTSKSEI